LSLNPGEGNSEDQTVLPSYDEVRYFERAKNLEPPESLHASGSDTISPLFGYAGSQCLVYVDTPERMAVKKEPSSGAVSSSSTCSWPPRVGSSKAEETCRGGRYGFGGGSPGLELRTRCSKRIASYFSKVDE
jgi:hypothetical protein